MDRAYVLALVRAHLLHNPSYLSWVPHYTSVRCVAGKAQTVTVGGHYRRKAPYGRTLSALACTCHMQELVYPQGATRVAPPPRVQRERLSRNGRLLPMQTRQLEFT